MLLALTFLVTLEGFTVASHPTEPAFTRSALNAQIRLGVHKVVGHKRIREMEFGYS